MRSSTVKAERRWLGESHDQHSFFNALTTTNVEGMEIK
jgi:hypothetical protein